MNETSHVDVFQAVITDALIDVHTALPGTVTSYATQTQRATVSLDIPVYQDYAMPDLRDVPVLWPACAAGILHLPLAAGDKVLVLFSEESIARWKASGAPGPSADPRRHGPDGAVALPIRVQASAVPASAAGLMAAEVCLADPNPSYHAARGETVDQQLAKVTADLLALKTALITFMQTIAPPGPPAPAPAPVMNTLVVTATSTFLSTTGALPQVLLPVSATKVRLT
jgi:hypothetical protein